MIHRFIVNCAHLVANPSAEPGRPAKTWGPVATLGLGAIATLVSQVPPLIVFFYWRGASVGRWREIATDGPAVVLFVCLSTPVQVALLAYFARKVGSTAVSYLALTVPSRRTIPLLAITALALLAASDGLSLAVGGHVVSSFQTDIYRSAAKAGVLFWLWLTVIAVAPIGEETLFRGFLFRGWQRTRHEAAIAISSTALLWAALHVQYSSIEMSEVFVVGLVLGGTRFISGSTVSSMVLHGVLNTAGMIETYITSRA